MPEKIFTLLGCIPFLITQRCDDGKQQIRFNLTRIVEALIIAIVSGIFSGYIALQKIEVKMDLLMKQVDKVESRLDDHIKITR